MKEVKINLYRIDELDPMERQLAIWSCRSSMLDSLSPEDFISGDPEFDTPEELGFQYDMEREYILTEDEPVLEYIEANNMLFFYDGSAAPTFYKYSNIDDFETASLKINLYGQELDVTDIVHVARHVPDKAKEERPA